MKIVERFFEHDNDSENTCISTIDNLSKLNYLKYGSFFSSVLFLDICESFAGPSVDREIFKHQFGDVS